jgi:hypothetical protein
MAPTASWGSPLAFAPGRAGGACWIDGEDRSVLGLSDRVAAKRAAFTRALAQLHQQAVVWRHDHLATLMQQVA